LKGRTFRYRQENSVAKYLGNRGEIVTRSRREYPFGVDEIRKMAGDGWSGGWNLPAFVNPD